MENNTSDYIEPSGNTSDRVPYLEIENTETNQLTDDQKQLVQILKSHDAMAFQAIPLSIENNTLNAAVVDHDNTEILNKLEKNTGYKIIATPLTPEMFVKFYQSLYEPVKNIQTDSRQIDNIAISENTVKRRASSFFNWQFTVIVLMTLFLFAFDVFFRHPIYWIFTILIWIFVWYNLRQVR